MICGCIGQVYFVPAGTAETGAGALAGAGRARGGRQKGRGVGDEPLPALRAAEPVLDALMRDAVDAVGRHGHSADGVLQGRYSRAGRRLAHRRSVMIVHGWPHSRDLRRSSICESRALAPASDVSRTHDRACNLSTTQPREQAPQRSTPLVRWYGRNPAAIIPTMVEPGTTQNLEVAMQTLNIPITGMSCGGCVENVRTALSSISGVTDAQVKVGAATVTFDPGRRAPRCFGERS